MPRTAGLKTAAPRGRRAIARPLTASCVLALVVAAVLPAGCAARSPSAAELAAPEAMPKSRSLPASPIRSGRVDVPPGTRVTAEALTAAVRADAAQVLGSPDAGSLSVAVESVTWSDGSLGCPQPGMMYTQALVPGWRVVVGDGRTLLRYHASANGAWMQCPAGLAGRPLPRDAAR